MPYIPVERRKLFDESIDNIVKHLGEIYDGSYGYSFDEKQAKGDLNYIIYSLVKRFTKSHGEGYFKISNMIGAVHDAEDELKRRLLHKYEDQAIEKNGDIE